MFVAQSREREQRMMLSIILKAGATGVMPAVGCFSTLRTTSCRGRAQIVSDFRHIHRAPTRSEIDANEGVLKKLHE